MNVCDNCFNDLELKEYVTSHSSTKGVCSYCQHSGASLVDINELQDFFTEFFEIFKPHPTGTSLVSLIKNDWNLFSNQSTEDKLLTDILSVIGSSLMAPNTKVSYIDNITECVDYWDTLKEELKWKRRFLTDLDKILDLGWDSFFIEQKECPVGDKLYRARIHDDAEQDKYPNKEMGPPSREKVKVGRANPEGIPYLYLSKNLKTTLYEIRATYLDEISIGTFKIKDGNKIILVDFTETVSAFLEIGNILEYTKGILLKKRISVDLSKPLRRYDSELEYIPTQFICEFVRYITGADGILFNSSLHEGEQNVVLFNPEKVECIGVEKHQIININIESNISR